MCGRYVITLPNDAMAQLFDAAASNDLPEGERYNVCPTNRVPVVTSDEGTRRLRPMRWGFIPHWYKTPSDGPLLINARSETIAEKPAFKAACRERRCLIPASGFYEWTKDAEGTRFPWYITRSDRQPLVFAGVWQDWARGDEAFTTCAIVTTAATGEITQLHKRQPVVLEETDWPLWLGEAGKGAATLMQGSPGGFFAFHRVDRQVNSNRAQGPELIEEISA